MGAFGDESLGEVAIADGEVAVTEGDIEEMCIRDRSCLIYKDVYRQENQLFELQQCQE